MQTKHRGSCRHNKILIANIKAIESCVGIIFLSQNFSINCPVLYDFMDV